MGPNPLLTEGAHLVDFKSVGAALQPPSPSYSPPFSSSQPHTVQARWENSLCGGQPQQFPMKGEFI